MDFKRRDGNGGCSGTGDVCGALRRPTCSSLSGADSGKKKRTGRGEGTKKNLDRQQKKRGAWEPAMGGSFLVLKGD